jgi:hypothetical protein
LLCKFSQEKSFQKISFHKSGIFVPKKKHFIKISIFLSLLAEREDGKKLHKNLLCCGDAF